jgi:predicted GNAT family N-acyltransferase
MSVVALERPAPAASRALNLDIDVARDLNALMRVFALRSVVFMGEQACPLDEEFDGNDLTGATHVLAELDGEPIATMRLRWFADFVKVERVLVRHEHRGNNGEIARELIEFALDLARRRGYRRALAYAQARLGGFWRRMGFTRRIGRERFVFSDHAYIEFDRTLAPHSDPLTMDSDPFVLMRPDGAWDAIGVLDRSAARPASNPHR